MLPEVKHLLDKGEVVTGNLDHQPTATEFLADMHQAFEIGIVIEGRSERRFGDFQMTVGPGGVWLVPAWEPHGYRWVGSRNFRLMVCFLPEFLGDETFDGVSWLSLFAAAAPERPWHLSAEAKAKTLAIARELGAEFSDASAGWRNAVRHGVLSLLLVLFRSWRLPRQQASLRACSTNNLARMAPALDLVQANPERRVGLAEAAEVCSLSPTQFRLVFRQTMGATFGVFTLRARLSHAAGLLAYTGLPLKAIAEQTGFTDHSHLHRAFSKAYGCTPGRYREQRARAGSDLPAEPALDG